MNTLTQYENNTGFISKIHYRPFDIQWTFYSEKQGFLGRPRYKTMQHFLDKENLGLCFIESSIHDYFSHSIVCSNITDGNFLDLEVLQPHSIFMLIMKKFQISQANF